MVTGPNEVYRAAHQRADTDFEAQSIHHTIGDGPTQSAPGNHNHDDVYALVGHNHDDDYASITDGTPIGAIIMYADSSIFPDTSWLSCEGQTISSLDYPDLCIILGDRYGAHVGTNYKLPDFRLRNPRGISLPGTPEGTTGGAETHTLVTANLPSHTHDFSHNHAGFNLNIRWTATTTVTGTGIRVTDVDAVSGGGGTSSNAVIDVPAHSGVTDSTGSGTAFNTMDPWIAVVFLIKALNNVPS